MKRLFLFGALCAFFLLSSCGLQTASSLPAEEAPPVSVPSSVSQEEPVSSLPLPEESPPQDVSPPSSQAESRPDPEETSPAFLPSILFRVVDEKGTPACNAMLYIYNPAGQLVDNDFLNAYGEHSMTPRSGAWEGVYTLTVEDESFQQTITAAHPSEQAVEITLSGEYTPSRPPNAALLTILAEGTGKPIPNLWVNRSEKWEPGQESPCYMDAGRPLLYTNLNGEVFFYAPDPGTYEVTITRRGFPAVPVTRLLEPFDDAGNIPDQTIYLTPEELDTILGDS